MRQMRSEASGAIGLIIRIGQELITERTRTALEDLFLPFVSSHLPDIHFRVHKSYALILSAAWIVSTIRVFYVSVFCINKKLYTIAIMVCICV